MVEKYSEWHFCIPSLASLGMDSKFMALIQATNKEAKLALLPDFTIAHTGYQLQRRA